MKRLMNMKASSLYNHPFPEVPATMHACTPTLLYPACMYLLPVTPCEYANTTTPCKARNAACLDTRECCNLGSEYDLLPTDTAIQLHKVAHADKQVCVTCGHLMPATAERCSICEGTAGSFSREYMDMQSQSTPKFFPPASSIQAHARGRITNLLGIYASMTNAVDAKAPAESYTLPHLRIDFARYLLCMLAMHLIGQRDVHRSATEAWNESVTTRRFETSHLHTLAEFPYTPIVKVTDIDGTFLRYEPVKPYAGHAPAFNEFYETDQHFGYADDDDAGSYDAHEGRVNRTSRVGDDFDNHYYKMVGQRDTERFEFEDIRTIEHDDTGYDALSPNGLTMHELEALLATV